LKSKFFVSRKSRRHKSGANVQRSTLNVQRSIWRLSPAPPAINTQLSTINCSDPAAA
jgi:hypothetical protein